MVAMMLMTERVAREITRKWFGRMPSMHGLGKKE
jgi:hypothetical protein